MHAGFSFHKKCRTGWIDDRLMGGRNSSLNTVIDFAIKKCNNIQYTQPLM
jgi:hypothetical protein